jgi:hypothetical protein
MYAGTLNRILILVYENARIDLRIYPYRHVITDRLNSCVVYVEWDAYYRMRILSVIILSYCNHYSRHVICDWSTYRHSYHDLLFYQYLSVILTSQCFSLIHLYPSCYFIIITCDSNKLLVLAFFTACHRHLAIRGTRWGCSNNPGLACSGTQAWSDQEVDPAVEDLEIQERDLE